MFNVSKKTLKIKTLKAQQLNYRNAHGFYLIVSPYESVREKEKTLFKCEVSLVKFYYINEEDFKGNVIGFGIWDGGGFCPISDIKLDSLFIDISDENFKRLYDLIDKRLVDDILIEYPDDNDSEGTIIVHKN
jgi:hypothetical protein